MLFSEEIVPINSRGKRESERSEEKAKLLKFALQTAVSNNPTDALLLSGGIDSALLAALSPQTPAITVVVAGRGVDLINAQRVTEHLGTPWHAIEITENEAIQNIAEIVQLTASYDPGILNDIPIYRGVRYAASSGWRAIRTGDAADTLFAGYSYLQNGIDFKEYLSKLVPQIRLSSSVIGKRMGVKMVYPYLHPSVLSLALSLDIEDNILDIETDQPGDFVDLLKYQSKGTKRWGKVVLRRAAHGLLPYQTIWRTKTDLEFGSGTYLLEEILANKIGSQEMKLLQESGKHFWNKFHSYLYLLYKELGQSPIEPNNNEYPCAWCGGGVIEGRRHCFTCGAFPANQKNMFIFENDRY